MVVTEPERDGAAARPPLGVGSGPIGPVERMNSAISLNESCPVRASRGSGGLVKLGFVNSGGVGDKGLGVELNGLGIVGWSGGFTRSPFIRVTDIIDLCVDGLVGSSTSRTFSGVKVYWIVSSLRMSCSKLCALMLSSSSDLCLAGGFSASQPISPLSLVDAPEPDVWIGRCALLLPKLPDLRPLMVGDGRGAGSRGVCGGVCSR